MGDSISQSYKTMGSTGVADPEAPCECVFVCICESKNGAPDIPGSDDPCAWKKAITNANEPRKLSSINSNCSHSIDNSNLQTDKPIRSTGVPKIPCGSSKSTASESDPDICCACSSKMDETNSHDSCKLGISNNYAANAGVSSKASHNLDSYVFASRLFDHFSKMKVKYKGRSRNLIMKYYDQTLEIYLKVCSTEKELDKDDFIKITNMLKTFKDKGLVTDNIFSNFKKAIKESGYFVSEIDVLTSNISEMNMEDYHQTPNAQPYFNTAANKLYCSELIEMVGDMKALEKKGVYPDVIFAKFMEPIEKSDAIQSRLNILQSLDFLVVMSDLKLLQREGWVSHEYISKYIEVNKLATDLVADKDVIANQMKNPVKRIIDGLKIKPNGEIKYDIEYRELPMEDANWELIGLRVCLSGHNTPFCEMCGLQNSWLKTFKKRGIHIKEADESNTKCIWHNNTKDK